MKSSFKNFFSPNKKTPSVEEVTERSTTKMGYFLLVCMWIALFLFGQWSLTIIRDIPTPPQGVASCIDNIVSTLDPTNENLNTRTGFSCHPNGGRGFDYNADKNQAALVGTNPAFNLTDSYTDLLPSANEIQALLVKREPLQDKIWQLQDVLGIARSEYDAALQEKMAGVGSPVYDVVSTGATSKENTEKLTLLNQQVVEIDREIREIRTNNSVEWQALKINITEIHEAYKSAYRWWILKVDFLALLFVGFIFAVLYRLYSRYKRINSPHTIIFSVATFAYGILLLQVVLTAIWNLIPQVFLQVLIDFFRNFSPVLYIIQFFIPLILVCVFGLLVYRIQRRLFSPENVLKRIVADERCPHCNNTVDIHDSFCPLCSYEIKVECLHCHKLTIKGMPFCSHCGKPNGVEI